MPPRRFRRSPARRWIIFALVLLLIATRWSQRDRGPAPPEIIRADTYQVRRVVDGDTLLLSNHARVRLIGVDTPETVKENHPVQRWGPEASDFTKRFVADAGGNVRLDFDQERKDRYGRFLAYVYHDQRMLNLELVRAGLARATLQYHFSERIKRQLRQAEQQAQAAGRGMWSTPPHSEDSSP